MDRGAWWAAVGSNLAHTLPWKEQKQNKTQGWPITTHCKLSPCLRSPKPHSLCLQALELEPPGPPLPSDLSPEDSHPPAPLPDPISCLPSSHLCSRPSCLCWATFHTLPKIQSVLPSWGRDKIKFLVAFSVFNREKSIQVDWFKSKSYLKEWLDLLHLHCLITSQFMANKKKHYGALGREEEWIWKPHPYLITEFPLWL